MTSADRLAVFRRAFAECSDLELSLQAVIEAHERERALLLRPTREVRADEKKLHEADRIVRFVASFYALSSSLLKQRIRKRSVAHPRFVAWWLIRKRVRLPYPTIADMFGVDHSSVIHGVRKVETSRDLRFEAEEAEATMRMSDEAAA